MRLFAALYPDHAALDAIERALDAAAPARASGAPLLRWVPREQLHITLAYFGDVPHGALDELGEELADAAARIDPFDSLVRGAGVFDHRVLWLGVGGDTEALRSLSRRCIVAGDAVGLRQDQRPRFRGHITVARAGHSARAVARTAERRRRRGDLDAGSDPLGRVLNDPAAALSVYAGPQWTAHELHVVVSERDEQFDRRTHRILGRWDLGSGRSAHRRLIDTL